MPAEMSAFHPLRTSRSRGRRTQANVSYGWKADIPALLQETALTRSSVNFNGQKLRTRPCI